MSEISRQNNYWQDNCALKEQKNGVVDYLEQKLRCSHRTGVKA